MLRFWELQHNITNFFETINKYKAINEMCHENMRKGTVKSKHFCIDFVRNRFGPSLKWWQIQVIQQDRATIA